MKYPIRTLKQLACMVLLAMTVAGAASAAEKSATVKRNKDKRKAPEAASEGME